MEYLREWRCTPSRTSLTGDAELQYLWGLADSTSASEGASITSFPEAVNWFLETYAETRALALAQGKFSRATKEPDEKIESFAVRIRGLSELCGSIYTEGTMKQQVIQGLPEYLRTDAFVYNTPCRTSQQLATSTAGKSKAAGDVIKLALGQGSSSQRASSSLSRRPVGLRPKKDLDMPPLFTANPLAPGTVLKGPLDAEIEKDKPGKIFGFRADTPKFLWARSSDSRQPYRFYLSWEAGHMAHWCQELTDVQRQAVLQARDSFLAATQGRSQSTEVKPQADCQFHRKMRAAMVQA